MWKLVLFICVLTCYVTCDENKKEGAGKEKCHLTADIKDLKDMVNAMRVQFTDNLSGTLKEIFTEYRFIDDISSLKAIVINQQKDIDSLKAVITKQEKDMSGLASSIVNQKELMEEAFHNLTDVVEGIAKKIGTEQTANEDHNAVTSDADLVEYPFLGLLGYGKSLNTVEWRGDVGTIISDRYILITAWRATEPYNGGLKYVALGVNNRTGSRQDWQIHEVKRMVVHPGYKRYGYQDDVALIETKKPIQFNDRVKVACLSSEQRTDAEATLATWYYSYTHSSVDLIRSVQVQRYTEAECSERYDDYNSTTQVCYGHKEDLRDSCNTWSSDPLVVHNDNSSCPTVISIRWYGVSCKLPDVYTMIYHYVPWIKNIVWP